MCTSSSFRIRNKTLAKSPNNYILWTIKEFNDTRFCSGHFTAFSFCFKYIRFLWVQSFLWFVAVPSCQYDVLLSEDLNRVVFISFLAFIFSFICISHAYVPTGLFFNTSKTLLLRFTDCKIFISSFKCRREPRGSNVNLK